MQKVTSLLILTLLALSTITVFATPAAVAMSVPKDDEVVWYDDPATPQIEGYENHGNLTCDPEWLKVRTDTLVHTDTTIIVQGLDCYGQSIEAKALIPKNTPAQRPFILNDTHTDPQTPVTFYKVTAILQQNGTHCNSFFVETHPEPFEEFLGYYHNGEPFKPGATDALVPPEGKYYHTVGKDKSPALKDYPPEPSNPDPIKIVINWVDDGDLYFENGEAGHANYATTLLIEGIDQCGNKLIFTVNVSVYNSIIHIVKDKSDVPPTPWPTGHVYVVLKCHTWSTICKVSGGAEYDSYYIFTEPQPQAKLFKYSIRIDHVVVFAECYDIFAHPDYSTTITVALVDQDGHLVHSADDNTLVNLKTSGGEIRPSNDLKIKKCQMWAKATLIADTNPRNVKVVAIVNVPEVKEKPHPKMNLIGWTEVCFDGVSSVYRDATLWPIDMLMWGYGGTGDTQNPYPVYLPVPPLPWLPGTPDDEKVNGPIYKVYIPLVVGCNLISVPIHPMLCTEYGYPYDVDTAELNPYSGQGIPMDIIFGEKSSATQTIEVIWWYNATDGTWDSYIPDESSDPDAMFVDGVGYWIKAEKPCTIVVSGVFMDNAPFVPPEYYLNWSWNLVGVTSLTRIKTDEYLESLAAGKVSEGVGLNCWGPVWVYDAKYGAWIRDPEYLWPTQGFWVNVWLPGWIAP